VTRCPWCSAAIARSPYDPEDAGPRVLDDEARIAAAVGGRSGSQPTVVAGQRRVVPARLLAQSTSHTTMRPPGRKTRRISASAAVESGTYSNTCTQSAASKLPSSTGRCPPRPRVARQFARPAQCRFARARIAALVSSPCTNPIPRPPPPGRHRRTPARSPVHHAFARCRTESLTREMAPSDRRRGPDKTPRAVARCPGRRRADSFGTPENHSGVREALGRPPRRRPRRRWARRPPRASLAQRPRRQPAGDFECRVTVSGIQSEVISEGSPVLQSDGTAMTRSRRPRRVLRTPTMPPQRWPCVVMNAMVQ
jgi:hypothetical protein